MFRKFVCSAIASAVVVMGFAQQKSVAQQPQPPNPSTPSVIRPQPQPQPLPLPNPGKWSPNGMNPNQFPPGVNPNHRAFPVQPQPWQPQPQPQPWVLPQPQLWPGTYPRYNPDQWMCYPPPQRLQREPWMCYPTPKIERIPEPFLPLPTEPSLPRIR